jgi:flagellar hook-length control protein FliK
MAAVSELQAAWPGSFGENLGVSLGGDLLKAVHLGPNMNVITSEAAVPDEQSLEAFARSQGLDETAVQWLMGSNPVITIAPKMTSLGALNALSNTGTVSSETNGAKPMTDLGEMSSSDRLGQPMPKSLGATLSGTPIETANGNLSVSKQDSSVLLNVLNAAALLAMAQGTEKAQVPRPAQEDPAEVAKVQINLMASPAPAAFWMLRNPMVAAPAKEAVATPSGASVSEIDLSQIATPELLDNLNQTLAEGSGLSTTTAGNDHPTPLSGHAAHRVDLGAAARQDAQNPDASASAPDSGNAQRSEKIQNLAEKMGQAVGQRILSEIEKGQWHLKLSLRPATLGHIEVEMRMRSGELDAIFTAPQALTRELLQEGMSKLKDTLSQMGMDVASVQVGDGQTQKRGGESTPGQMSKSAKDSSDDTQSSLSAVQAPNTRMKMGQDGWDVLV